MGTKQHSTLTAAELHATKIDSVGAAQLKVNAVETPKIKDDQVTPVKVSSIDVPADGEMLIYDVASGKFEWVAPPVQFTPLPKTTYDWWGLDNWGAWTSGAWDIDKFNAGDKGVPVGAIAIDVLLEIKGQGGLAGPYSLTLRKNATHVKNIVEVSGLDDTAAPEPDEGKDGYIKARGILMIDSNLLFDLFVIDPSTNQDVMITILGYWS